MQDSAVLLIDCPDRRGLVARVASLLYEQGANILHADQHRDEELGLFFMRVEFALNGTAGAPFDLGRFERAFAPLAEELQMRWTLTSSAHRTRVALFCSHYLHCMADLLERWRSGELRCDIPVIVSNHRDVEGLAQFYGIPFAHVLTTAATRVESESRQLAILADHGVELVVLARFMQVLSPGFVARYPAVIINVHHS